MKPVDPSVMEEDSEVEEDEEYYLPVTHEAILKGHTKTVTAMDIDHSGSRVITGSLDYSVRVYDFNGMKNDMRSFRCASELDSLNIEFLLC